MSAQASPRYAVGVAATTAVNFSIGRADALFVTATLSSGLTVELIDGTTLTLGNQTLGTWIYIQCTKATFAAGTIVALRV